MRSGESSAAERRNSSLEPARGGSMSSTTDPSQAPSARRAASSSMNLPASPTTKLRVFHPVVPGVLPGIADGRGHGIHSDHLRRTRLRRHQPDSSRCRNRRR